MKSVLVTGGLGLIGPGLIEYLQAKGAATEVFDLRGSRSGGTFGDVCDIDGLRRRVAECDGIVHLAAVSRVIWGESDPAACWSTNVDGTSNVLRAAAELPHGRRPWIIYASSREVYGEADRLPVHEDAPLKPMNVYGRSKAAAEALMEEARLVGLTTAVVRFSNVFGSTSDYADRVVPAFARAAATAGTMRVEGNDRVFDFTWRDDVCRGLTTLCQAMAEERASPPPIHFVTGRGTTLIELAEMARVAGHPDARIEHHAPRVYDVERFRGDPRRAEQILGWRAETPVEMGVRRLVEAFMAEPGRRHAEPMQPNVAL